MGQRESTLSQNPFDINPSRVGDPINQRRGPSFRSGAIVDVWTKTKPVINILWRTAAGAATVLSGGSATIPDARPVVSIASSPAIVEQHSPRPYTDDLLAPYLISSQETKEVPSVIPEPVASTREDDLSFYILTDKASMKEVPNTLDLSVLTEQSKKDARGDHLARQQEAQALAAEVARVASAPPTKKTEIISEQFIMPIEVRKQLYGLNCEEAVMESLLFFWEIKPQGGGIWQTNDPARTLLPTNENPHEGFRGDRNGGPTNDLFNYGAYAEPVAATLSKMGLPSEARYGLSSDDLAEAVKEGKPVIVWVSRLSNPFTYVAKAKDGKIFRLVSGEHVWLVIGEEIVNGKRLFLVIDPQGGYKTWVDGFPNWDKFDFMGVVVQAPKAKK